MKKLFTLLAIGLFAFLARAQNVTIDNTAESILKSGLKEFPAFTPLKLSKKTSSGRATVSNFEITYRDNEDLYAEKYSYNSSGFGMLVNDNFPATSGAYKNIAVLFDSLIENKDDFQSFDTRFYPKKESTIKINAVYLPLLHDKGAPGKNDTFKISIFKLPANYSWRNPANPNANWNLGGLVTGSGANERLNTQPYEIWADSSNNFVADSFAIASQVLGSGETLYYIGDTALNLQLAKGETFGVRVDFKGDTANSLRVLIGYHDQCDGAADASPAVYPNFVGYLNLGANSSVFRDQLFYPSSPVNCNRLELQNVSFYADVDVENDNFGVVAAPNTMESCPGGQVDLKANFFGSSEATFTWSSKTGNLSSVNDEEVTLTLSNTNQNDTVTLIGTDSSGLVNDTSVIIIKNNGIGITFTNSPYSINCGAKATAASTLSGYTVGQRTFQWDIDTDPLVDSTTTTGSMGGLLPGNYSVTVTNSKGCQTSASFSVEYNNGVTNTVNFTTPDVIPGGAAQVCINVPYTFVNTSTNKDGWDVSWSFGDANGGTDVTTDAFFGYTAIGTFKVNLSMDSAGCKFVGPEKSVQVLPATNGACTNSINEIAFDQSVELMPNPNNGLVTINVANIEKGINIQVFNILGSEVKQFTSKDAFGTFSKSFDYSDLSKGAYLVKIQSGSKVAVKRMIVNK